MLRARALTIAVALGCFACSESGGEVGTGGGGGGGASATGVTAGPGPSGTGTGANSGSASSGGGTGSSTHVTASASVGTSDVSVSASSGEASSSVTTGEASSSVTTSDASSSVSASEASASTSATDASSSAEATVAVTTVAASTGSGGDPFEEERQLCIDTINALRASVGLPAYGRWTSGESCADGQATSDEQSGTPHGAFGQCGEFGQNECLGAGPSGIASCLNAMWNERNQDGCSGCDACNDAYDPDCPNCDFYGTETGDVCGHYVNMSALYFDEAACGFSSLGGWDVINFR